MQWARPFLVRCAVFQNECRNSQSVEVLGYLFPFVIVSQTTITPARTDHHRGTIGLTGRRAVEGEARFVRVRIAHREGGFSFPQRNGGDRLTQRGGLRA